MKVEINLITHVPDEDKTFSGSLVMIWWRDVNALVPLVTDTYTEIECVRCHAIENKIKNHASDKVKKIVVL